MVESQGQDGLPAQVQVLLVDDDEGHVTLIRNNLREVGLVNPIRRFCDGQEILDFLFGLADDPEPVDFARAYLLLLDIRMPKVSGDEVLRRIKEDERLSLIPVIMLTTTDDPREVRRCYQLGCSEYISKPVDSRRFIEVIRRLGLFLQVVCVPRIEEAP